MLSEKPHRDSYSYHLASVYLGADDETDLTTKFDHVAAALGYDTADVTP